jgi:Zn-dependent protease with chaperone function
VNRNLVLVTLLLCVCGCQVCLAGLLPFAVRRRESGREMERRSWRRLLAPLLPALVIGGLLVGWALQEPSETDEILRPDAFVCGAAIALVWGRAAWRALWALRSPRGGVPAATLGLFRPRILVDEGLRQSLDRGAVEALLAHEQAHVAHRDPLRIWIAQLTTDLQWPTRAASRRLRAWLDALELARDEEARAAGARGGDLAAAIVAAARLATGRSPAPAAPLTGADEGRNLAERIDRLFVPVPPAEPPSSPWKARTALALAVALALAAGLTHGDTAVRALSIFVLSPGSG